MEDILHEIKTSIDSCTPDELQERISVWRNQFRQRGISIIALETLLNFYLEPHLTREGAADEAFVHPKELTNMNPLAFDKEFNMMRNKVENLEKEKRSLLQEISRWRKWFYVFMIVSVLLSISIIILIITYK